MGQVDLEPVEQFRGQAPLQPPPHLLGPAVRPGASVVPRYARHNAAISSLSAPPGRYYGPATPLLQERTTPHGLIPRDLRYLVYLVYLALAAGDQDTARSALTDAARGYASPATAPDKALHPAGCATASSDGMNSTASVLHSAPLPVARSGGHGARHLVS
jgi:hypothetical protein